MRLYELLTMYNYRTNPRPKVKQKIINKTKIVALRNISGFISKDSNFTFFLETIKRIGIEPIISSNPSNAACILSGEKNKPAIAAAATAAIYE